MHLTRCPGCNKTLQVPAEASGRTIGCPLCGQLFAVKAAAPAPATLPMRPTNHGNGSSSAAPAIPSVAQAKPEPSPTACPGCGRRLASPSESCPNCGYLLRPVGSDLETEALPNLCPNPACGVANGQAERHCQRCGSPLPHPAGALLHGRYRIDKLLAIGGFSAVYLAADVSSGDRLVAFKDMICSDPKEFPIRLSFFQREAEILQTLARFPIVPRFIDYRHKGQSACLVLEYIRGKDLNKILEENGGKPFPLNQVLEWGQSICDVLSHMHSLVPPVVHRDLKPENIMLMEDQRTIRMIDFGTARDVDRGQSHKPGAMTRVYTEGYAPPEQIVGKPEARSDLFALAGTLFHLATGKAPDFHTARVLEKQLKDKNGSITAADRWFYELIRTNLAEDVNDRYFSTRELKQDLQRRAITREVECPRCEHANPVRQPYCGKCAAPLTDSHPCPRCNRSNRMGSRWCIYCGERFR